MATSKANKNAKPAPLPADPVDAPAPPAPTPEPKAPLATIKIGSMVFEIEEITAIPAETSAPMARQRLPFFDMFTTLPPKTGHLFVPDSFWCNKDVRGTQAGDPTKFDYKQAGQKLFACFKSWKDADPASRSQYVLVKRHRTAGQQVGSRKFTEDGWSLYKEIATVQPEEAPADTKPEA